MATAEMAAVVAARLFRCQRAVFLTGAGLSKASGLPVYRGDGGMYEAGADGSSGVDIQAALSGMVFEADPGQTWEHLSHVGRRMFDASPNDGHRSIARIQKLLRETPAAPADNNTMNDELPVPLREVGKPLGWTTERAVVVTQNIDGYHAECGTEDVIEIHGNARRFLCSRCQRPIVTPTGPHQENSRVLTGAVDATCAATEWFHYKADFSKKENVPLCGDCGGVVRPDVVLFGEQLPVIPLRRLMVLKADVCVLVGTTAQFPYIVEPFYDTSYRGGFTANINPTKDDEIAPWTNLHMAVPASEALVSIADALEGLVRAADTAPQS